MNKLYNIISEFSKYSIVFGNISFFLGRMFSYKKKLIFKAFFFILIFVNLQSDAAQHVISLGPNCGPAMCLAYHKVRKEAYPFDWVVCNFDSMYKLLETDFENYLLPENLIISPTNPWFVIDTHTNVQYNHDFPIENTIDNKYEREWEDSGGVGCIMPDFLNYLPAIYEKYQRRINRLRQVLQSNDKVIFMHFGISKIQAVSLRNFLENRYPNLDFEILAVNLGQRSIGEWNETKIKDYKIPDLSWDMSVAGYEYILRDMDLIPKED